MYEIFLNKFDLFLWLKTKNSPRVCLVDIRFNKIVLPWGYNIWLPPTFIVRIWRDFYFELTRLELWQLLCAQTVFICTFSALKGRVHRVFLTIYMAPTTLHTSTAIVRIWMIFSGRIFCRFQISGSFICNKKMHWKKEIRLFIVRKKKCIKYFIILKSFVHIIVFQNI